MNAIEQYQYLKGQLDKLRTKAQRAEGALEQNLARLQEEHGVATIPEARQKLQRLEKQLREAERTFKSALEEFETQWGELLS